DFATSIDVLSKIIQKSPNCLPYSLVTFHGHGQTTSDTHLMHLSMSLQLNLYLRYRNPGDSFDLKLTAVTTPSAQYSVKSKTKNGTPSHISQRHSLKLSAIMKSMTKRC